MRADNKILERKLNAQIKLMDNVRWYINVMEQGVDASDAMRDFAKVRDQRDAFEKELKMTKKQKNAEISTLHKKIQKLE